MRHPSTRLRHSTLLCLVLGLLAWPGGGAQEAQDEKKGGIPTPEEVRAQREAEAARRIEQERAAHFRICDSDRNGWISWREAEFALLMDREEYWLYDKNADGKIDPAEFEARYAAVLAQVGGLPVLREELQAKIREAEPPELTPIESKPDAKHYLAPADLVLAYDADENDGLDLIEITQMFHALAVDLSPDVALSQMDRNNTGTLELGELGPLTRIMGERLLPGDEAPRELDDSEVFSRLYSSSRPRLQPEGAAPLPPLIPGPVSHFRRLDVDDDGFIDAVDLQLLISPSRIDVRPTAVLAALDRDGDGRLDESEFLRSVGGTRGGR